MNVYFSKKNCLSKRQAKSIWVFIGWVAYSVAFCVLNILSRSLPVLCHVQTKYLNKCVYNICLQEIWQRCIKSNVLCHSITPKKLDPIDGKGQKSKQKSRFYETSKKGFL